MSDLRSPSCLGVPEVWKNARQVMRCSAETRGRIAVGLGAHSMRMRNEIYHTNHRDGKHIRDNIGRIQANQEAAKLERSPLQPLALPVK
jgi:hypothetical protein